jgi:PLP dependent protein
MSRHDDLTQAWAGLRTRLAEAAQAAGRDVGEIQLLPITKFFPASDVAILVDLGCRAFGESRDQEARDKIATLSREPGWPDDVRWHMIGQIQRNKARSIAGWADTVHSVSTPKVAAALERGAVEALAEGRRTAALRVYIQISLDGDVSRGGVDIGDPDAVDALCAQVHAAEGLELVGLMGIPPLDADPEQAFATLAAERNRVQRQYQQRLGLSAGMTGDLEAAVKHGSTCVRVGTALMGPRPLTSP